MLLAAFTQFIKTVVRQIPTVRKLRRIPSKHGLAFVISSSCFLPRPDHRPPVRSGRRPLPKVPFVVLQKSSQILEQAAPLIVLLLDGLTSPAQQEEETEGMVRQGPLYLIKRPSRSSLLQNTAVEKQSESGLDC